MAGDKCSSIFYLLCHSPSICKVSYLSSCIISIKLYHYPSLWLITPISSLLLQQVLLSEWPRYGELFRQHALGPFRPDSDPGAVADQAYGLDTVLVGVGLHPMKGPGVSNGPDGPSGDAAGGGGGGGGGEAAPGAADVLSSYMRELLYDFPIMYKVKPKHQVG